MAEINGEHGVILAKLETHTKLFEKLDYKIDNMLNDIRRQDKDINGIGIKTQSIQCELTEYKKENPIGKELTEHKSDHRWNNAFILSVASFFSGVIAWIVQYFRGK